MANNTDRNERLFDAMLKVAAEEATIQEMDEFPSREELEKLYPRSEAFDKRIAKIIGKHDRKEKRKKAVRTFARAAAVVGIFFTVCIITLMSVEASRNFILRRIFNVYDDFVVFEFGELDHDALYYEGHVYFYFYGDEWQEEYGELRFPSDGTHPLQGFLPAGYEYIHSYRRPTSNLFIFENEVGWKIFFQQNEKSETLRMFVDNANRDLTIREINNREVFVFESSDTDNFFHTLMWEDDRYVFNLDALIDIDELIDIARNLIR